MTVTIRYFAMLREKSGVERETVTIPASADSTDGAFSPRHAYEESVRRHGISLDPQVLRAAVNGRYVAWDTPLHDGDEVVFIPPVSGG